VSILESALIATLLIFVIAALIIMTYIFYKLYREMNNKKCYWKSKSKYNDEYRTRCGNDFYNSAESGAPASDWVKYCPFCSSEVSEKAKAPGGAE
jgi:hypothetical protein